MKKIIFILTIVSSLLLTGCANLLMSVPNGSVASEAQVRESAKELRSRLNGLYSSMVQGNATYMGSQKYIDVYTDIFSSEAAVPKNMWGFMKSAELLLGANKQHGFNNFLWTYEYKNIRNANLLIIRCNDVISDSTKTKEIKYAAEIILGQALALRGYFYYTLTNIWTNPAKVVENQPILPYYNEINMEVLQALSSYNFIIDRAERDILGAIDKLQRYNRSVAEKIYIDADVAKIILANLYLNRAKIFDNSKQVADCTEALKLAEEVIATNKYHILPYNDVLTNGFNNVKSQNWMWGIDIVPEITRSINSFWSLVDIYTYGYASAGDIIALDDSIYNNFNTLFGKLKTDPITDMRYQWWEKPSEDGNFNLAPTGKFFDPAKQLQADRNWTHDLVFMRIEEAYLIAAEAAFAINNEVKAKKYIKDLMLQRDTTAATATRIDALTGENLKNYIASNWRIEMWLEGKSYMALKRFNWKHTRGSNRASNRNVEVNISDETTYLFETPYSEFKYNPNVGEGE